MAHSRLYCTCTGGVLLVIATLAVTAIKLRATPAKSNEQSAEDHSCQPALFKIALDIGHYRASPGVISATGVTEFEYNLSLARAVIAAL